MTEEKKQEYAQHVGPYRFIVTFSPSPFPCRALTDEEFERADNNYAGMIGRLGAWYVIDDPEVWEEWKRTRYAAEAL